MRSQRQIECQTQRRRLAGAPVRTGKPPRPRPTLRLRKIVWTRDFVARHRQIPGARNCLARHRQVPWTRNRVARHGQVPRAWHRVARHRQVPRARNCVARHRQVPRTRDRVARHGQVVSQSAGGRSDPEDRAAVDTDVVHATGRNLAADFLSLRTFWTDDFESGQAKSPGPSL